jgi:hypothetical protein
MVQRGIMQHRGTLSMVDASEILTKAIVGKIQEG